MQCNASGCRRLAVADVTFAQTGTHKLCNSCIERDIRGRAMSSNPITKIIYFEQFNVDETIEKNKGVIS